MYVFIASRQNKGGLGPKQLFARVTMKFQLLVSGLQEASVVNIRDGTCVTHSLKSPRNLKVLRPRKSRERLRVNQWYIKHSNRESLVNT